MVKISKIEMVIIAAIIGILLILGKMWFDRNQCVKEVIEECSADGKPMYECKALSRTGCYGY